MNFKHLILRVGVVACAATLAPAGAKARQTTTQAGSPNQTTSPGKATSPGQTATPGQATPSTQSPAAPASPVPASPSPTTTNPTAPSQPGTTGLPNSPGTAPGAASPLPAASQGTTMQPSQALSPGQISAPGVTLLPGQGSAQPNASPAIGGAGQAINSGQGSSIQSGPLVTLNEALKRAQANEPTFVAAVAASRTAALDRSIAKAALLPSVIYHNQYLYTQPSQLAGNQTVSANNQATLSAPRFIANNTVHEYVSQGVASETIGLAQWTAVSRASAAAAIANAELEISRRGLTSTVVSLFYTSTTSVGKVAIQQRALDEASSFVLQTQQREAAREAAHADVLKAQLTLQQRQRDIADAQLQAEKARLDLGVLLFPDPRSQYTVTLPAISPPPARAAVEAASKNNPELMSALATLRSKSLDITAARAAYLPDLALAYSYGIDAAQFAVHGPDGSRNLGYSASATVDIPVWDWFATQHKIKQAQILRDSAKVALSSAQRTLIAQLDEYYAESTVAYGQLESLNLSVQTAQESLRLTRLRYTAGESTVLEVVDAQNSLTTAELAQIDGSVRYQLALANLQLLTGTI